MRRVACLSALLPVFLLACPHEQAFPPTPTPPAPSGPEEPPEPVVVVPSKSGLGFRLSEAEPKTEPRSKLARTIPLSEGDAKALFARLPALATQPDDEKDFALREKSQPPPRTGKVIQEAFPPPVTRPLPAPQATGPLKVLRHLPEGDVSLAPNLSVTFSQPMVPVTSTGELSAADSPVKLTPTPPGKWRWIGTQTLLFEPTARFPMATDYAVEIPAGLRSANGGTLDKAESWAFATPPIQLQTYSPQGSSVKLDPLLVVAFDQKITPSELLAVVEVRAGGKALPVRLATDDEIEADPGARRFARGVDKGRTLFLRPQSKLAPDTEIETRFPRGTPSAEGPKRTAGPMGFSFRTFGPLTLTHHSCSWSSVCPPLTPITAVFSNPIDARRFDKTMVTVDPPIEGFKVSVFGNELVMQGQTKGHTTYKFSFAGLTDTFGQPLAPNTSFDQFVSPAEPLLFSEERAMAVVDPTGEPKLPLFSINEPKLRARYYEVTASDWPRYVKFRQDWDYEGKRTEPPGKLLATRQIDVRKAPDELVETELPLAPGLHDGLGQVLVVVEPARTAPKGYRLPSVRTWLQVTHLGLDAFTDHDQAVAWVTDLASGKPVDRAEVSFTQGGAGQTGPDGLALLKGARSGALVARQGQDSAVLIDDYRGVFHDYRSADHPLWFVFDDRGTYKPGEEVHLKGYLRLQRQGKGEDISALPDVSKRTVDWQIQDAMGVEIGKGKDLPVSELGTFHVSFELPKTPNLGPAYLTLTSGGDRHGHSIMIQEFRRPEFEVTARVSDGPHQVGRHATVTAAARYYAGGGLSDAPVEWTAHSETAYYSPPNRSDYHFGRGDQGWWSLRRPEDDRPHQETLASHTNAAGDHTLRVDFDSLEPSYPITVSFEAGITDVNRQRWVARTSTLVHPSDLCVGLRPSRYFVRVGEPLSVDSIVTDIDGKARTGVSFKLRASRLDVEQVNGEDREVESDIQGCELTSTEAAVPCKLSPHEAGRYRLVAIVTDAFGRKSQSDETVWVHGDSSRPERGLAAEQVRVVPDRSEYKPGDTAELLLFSPITPAEGVVTVERQGIVHLARFTMKSAVESIKVPIGAGSFPSVSVKVQLVGSAARENAAGDPDPGLPRRPAHAAGQATLAVPPDERRLEVKTRAREQILGPGGKTTIEVDVTDSKGAGAPGAEVALAIVDEAILALGPHVIPDPVRIFYATRPDGGNHAELRSEVLLGRPAQGQIQAKAAPAKASKGGKSRKVIPIGEILLEDRKEDAPSAAPPPPSPSPVAAATATAMASAMALPKAESKKAEESNGDKAGREPGKPIALRSDFNPVAAFVPAARTDGAGHVSIPVKLPDSLTRYRIMAVAVSGEKDFGKGEGTMTARLPLMLRPSAPRFLNFGDRFDLPVVVQNQTGAPLEVDLVARASNALLTGGPGQRFMVPANDRVEVRLPAAAARPGKARFQFGVATGGFADASSIELPVWTPATTEAFATYGTIDEGSISQPIKAPAGVEKSFGGLEISTSTTALASLTDAVLYLVKYPYDCNEQLASRILAIAALRDVLTAFNSPALPKPAALVESVRQDLDRLRGRQHYSGGFSFWGGDQEPWPYLSIHVMHALARAKDKGFTTPKDTISRGLSYLRSIESHIPYYYGPEARRSLIAYALFVRQKHGDRDTARARRLLVEAGGVDKTPLEALGWLLPVLSGDTDAAPDVEAIHRHLANRVSETAGAAHFVTSYSDSDHLLLSSDRRTDGVLLEALIGDRPSSDLIPKLVTGLLAHRTAGRWYNTQENAFILLALDRYFNTYEKATPDLVARAWFGEQFAGEQAFKGRTTDQRQIAIPMATVAAAGTGDITLQKDGTGRLYYRIGMNYAPSDLRPPPLDQGFSVRRSYEGADQPDDARRAPDGTWHLRLGSRIRVRLAMVAPSRRYHVALVDPLPAGLEALNGALAVTETAPPDPKTEPSPTWWWGRGWYDHQNTRDERVEAYTSLLWEGVYDYNYVARATTPGTFFAPPPKAEEMYNPETFGRGAGDQIIIE
jgi:hypothetical protein